MFKRLQQSRGLRHRLGASRGRLFRVAYAWCHDRHLADDLAQQTLDRGLRKLSQLREPEQLEAWLFRILHNCWKDHLRSRREHMPWEDEHHWHEHSPEAQLRSDELTERVRLEIRRLPDAQREVVTLVDLTELSYAQVAEVLEIPIGTVMSRLCRGRRTLRDQLFDLRPQAETAMPQLRRVK